MVAVQVGSDFVHDNIFHGGHFVIGITSIVSSDQHLEMSRQFVLLRFFLGVVIRCLNGVRLCWKSKLVRIIIRSLIVPLLSLKWGLVGKAISIFEESYF